ncbi:MAG: HD domain-containing protein, partial [Desulfobacterales bacterium]|nr:HD domain-containing protein [Desulfobacterales bacterium]
MSHNSLVFLKGLCKGLGNTDTLHAINAAEVLHSGQVRLGNGEPYVYHPTQVACHLAALGITGDPFLAAAMDHDLFEDCDTGGDELRDRFGVSDATIGRVHLLSKHEGQSTEEYYLPLYEDPVLTLVKIADRCHNVSTMGGAFTDAKIREYIAETEEHVIPLCKHAKRYWPEYGDAVFAMKYHILSLTRTL